MNEIEKEWWSKIEKGHSNLPSPPPQHTCPECKKLIVPNWKPSGWLLDSMESRKLGQTIVDFKELLNWIIDHEQRVSKHGALYTNEITQCVKMIQKLLGKINEYQGDRL